MKAADGAALMGETGSSTGGSSRGSSRRNREQHRW
jgi:hypothetical protein